MYITIVCSEMGGSRIIPRAVGSNLSIRIQGKLLCMQNEARTTASEYCKLLFAGVRAGMVYAEKICVTQIFGRSTVLPEAHT